MSTSVEGICAGKDSWTRVGSMQDKAQVKWNDVKFFPFHNPKCSSTLEDMRGVVAVCGADKIQVIKLDPVTADLDPLYEIVDQSHRITGGRPEVFQSLSWSIDPTSLQPVLAAGGARGVIKLFDGRKGTEIGMLYGHGGTIMALAFSPANPHLIASASIDHTVRIWNAGLSLTAHQTRPGLQSSDLLPNWDNPPGQLIAVLTGVGGHRAPVCSVAWHPTLPLLATGGMDHQLKVWYLTRLPGFPPHSILRASPELAPDPSSTTVNIQPAPVLQLPIFSSCHIHAHWIDQIIWPSSLAPILISKSSIIGRESNHPLAQFAPESNLKPASEVCIWHVKVLEDVFSDRVDYLSYSSDLAAQDPEDGGNVGGLDFDVFWSLKVRRPILNAEDESVEWGVGMCLAENQLDGDGPVDLAILMGNHPDGIAEVTLTSLQTLQPPPILLHPSSPHSLIDQDDRQVVFRAIDFFKISLPNRPVTSFVLRVGSDGQIELWKRSSIPTHQPCL